MLYLVGTPIGNLKDISSRALEVLSEVDLICCEDTRVTGLLLSKLGIKNKLFSYHEHNKASKGKIIIDYLKDGMNIALVSDAGMPSISDPGEDLVLQSIENDIAVTTVPGPTAFVSALVLSGLSTRRYYFEGFLPSENKERRERLTMLSSHEETIILYEAPHRLNKLIDELSEMGFNDSRAAFAREITKKYEEVIRLKVSEAKEYFIEHPPKGEFVICLEGFKKIEQDYSEDEIRNLIMKYKDEGMSSKDISKIVSKMTGKSKKEIYNLITLL